MLMLSVNLTQKLVKLLQRMPEGKVDRVYSIRLLILLVSSRRLVYKAMKVHGARGLRSQSDYTEQNIAGFLQRTFSLAGAVLSFF